MTFEYLDSYIKQLASCLDVSETNVKLTLFELAVGPREISREVVLGGMTMPSNVTNAILAVCHAKENMPTIEQFRSLLNTELPKKTKHFNNVFDDDDDNDNDNDDKVDNNDFDDDDDTLVFECLTQFSHDKLSAFMLHSPQLFAPPVLARLKKDQHAYTQMGASVTLDGVLGRLIVREQPELHNGTPAPLTFSQPFVYDFLPDAVILRRVPRGAWRKVRVVRAVPSEAEREAMRRRQMRVDPAIPTNVSSPTAATSGSVRVDANDDGSLTDDGLCSARLARLERYLRFVSTGEATYRGSFVRSAEVERFRTYLSTNLIGVAPMVKSMDSFFDLFTDDDGIVPRGMLFYGPPGVGKTKLARAVSHMDLVPLCEELSSSDFRKPLQGMAERMVAELGRRAALVPWQLTFMSVDEIDGMAAARQGKQGDSGASTLNKMLSLIEGNQNVRNLIVIGSTNNIGDLDKAFARRLHFKVFVGPPASDARREWIEWRTVTDRLKIFCRNHESWCMLRDTNVAPELQRQWSPRVAASKRAELRRFEFNDELVKFVVSLTLNFSNDAMLLLLRKVAVSSVGSRSLADVRTAACAPFQLEQASDWQSTTRGVREAWLHKLVRQICQSEEIFLGSRMLPDIVLDPGNRLHGSASVGVRDMRAFSARIVKACRATDSAAPPLVGVRSWVPTGRLLVDLSAPPGEQMQLQVVKTGLTVERDQLELLRVNCDSLCSHVRACVAHNHTDVLVNEQNEPAGVARYPLEDVESLLSTLVELRTMFDGRALHRALGAASAQALAPLRHLVTVATVKHAIEFVLTALEAWRVLSSDLITVVSSTLATVLASASRDNASTVLLDTLANMLGAPPSDLQRAVSAVLMEAPLALIIRGRRHIDPDTVTKACVAASGALWAFVDALLLELVAFFDFGRQSRRRHDIECYGSAPNSLSYDQSLFQMTEIARDACIEYVTLVDHQTMVRRGANDEQAQINFVSQVLKEAQAAQKGALVIFDLDSIAGMHTTLATPSSESAFALMQLNRRDQRIFDATPSAMSDVGGNRSFQHVVLREPLKQAVLEAFQQQSLTTNNVWLVVVARDGFLAASVRQMFSSGEWSLRERERKLLAQHRDSVRVKRCVNCNKEFTTPRNTPDSCRRHSISELFVHSERAYNAKGNDDPVVALAKDTRLRWTSLGEVRSFLTCDAMLKLAPEARVEIAQRIKWLCCGRAMGEYGCVQESHRSANDVRSLSDDNDDNDDNSDDDDVEEEKIENATTNNIE